MSSDIKAVILSVLGGGILELLKYSAKVYFKKTKSNNSNVKHSVFSLSSNKKEVTLYFYLSFFTGVILMLVALLGNFKNIESVLGIEKPTFIFVISTFSIMFIIEHFISFHESLAHWGENSDNRRPNSIPNTTEENLPDSIHNDTPIH